MAKTYFLQNNFSSGELTPKLFSRGDLEQYNNGLDSCTNWNVITFGGLRTRPGTEYIGRAKQTDIRLIPFEFNNEQTYVIEAGNLYFRFYSDGGRILNATQAIATVSNSAGLININIVGHGYTTGNDVVISGVLGTIEANGEWRITVVDADNFTLNGSVFANPYNSGGTVATPFELTTIYTTADLANLQWVQDANELYIVDGAHPPQVMTRTSATTFTIAALAITGGPFLPTNETGFTLTASATTGTVTLTASGGDIFDPNDVGRFVAMAGTTGSPAEQGYLEITAYTSITVVTAVVRHTLSSAAATLDWAFGAFGGDAGYPSVVGFVQQRLVFAETDTTPETIWFSTVADITDFSLNTGPERAFNLIIDSRTANVIRWIFGKGDVLVGTSGAEYSLAAVGGAGLTGTTTVVKEQTPYGSNTIKPVLIDNKVVYVNRSGRRLRAMGFLDDINEFESPDLSLLAPHLLEDSPIQHMAYQQEPNTTLWMVLESGDIASATILQSQKILAWSKHTFENGLVKDVVTLHDDGSKEDEVYVAVERVVNSVTVTYVERFRQSIFVDSATSGDVGGATTLYNLHHLEGEEVEIIGDGAPYRPKTVTNGSVTIDVDELPITNGLVGLNVTAEATTIEPEFQTQDGVTSFGRKKRWVRVAARTVDTLTICLNDAQQPERDTEDLMGSVVPTPAEFDFVVYNLEYNQRAKLRLAQKVQLPATITGIFGVVEVGDQ